MRAPSYEGEGLVNLVAEIEARLTGASASSRLNAGLGAHIPEASTYVLALFDGLGDLQLRAHPDGRTLARHRVGALDAPFSSQTSVATATLATGLPPVQHGLISYLLRFSGSDRPVNTLWWFDVDGAAAEVDHAAFLPAPNLAERVAGRGAEVVLIEPAAFAGGPMDRVLFRGARTRGEADFDAMIKSVLEEAAEPGKIVVCYLPQVDAAGHAEGTGSAAYAEALRLVSSVWEAVGSELGDHAAMVGTADHGMVDIAVSGHVEIEPPKGLTLYGDSRVVYVSGDAERAERLVSELPATWVTDLEGLWGPGPEHPDFANRRPDGLIVADDGVAFTYPGSQLVLAGHHGGLSEAELRIPLLVYGSDPGDL